MRVVLTYVMKYLQNSASVNTPITHKVKRTRSTLPKKRAIENRFFFFFLGAGPLPPDGCI